MKKDKITKTINSLPVIELTPEQRLNSVKGTFKQNIHKTPRQTSEEIFKAHYANPKGGEYWRGQFERPSLDVVTFSEILAIHKATEEADTNAEGFTLRYDDEGEPFHVSLSIATQQKYDALRRKVLETLRDAAKGDASFFRGDNALLREMNDGELFQGWKYGHLPTYQTRPLTDVILNPREAFEWFASTSIYADRLPKSLSDWLFARSATKDKTTTAQGIEDSQNKKEKIFEGWKEITDEISKRIKSITTKQGARSYLKRKKVTLIKSQTGKPTISEKELINLSK
jgi:hypothetical protein